MFRDEAINALRQEFFSRSDLPAIPFLITPLLIHRPQFPFIRYLEMFDLQSISDRKSKLHQLHTVLMIIDDRLNQLPPTFNKQILAIIRYCVPGLIATNSLYHYRTEENADHDDNDQMEMETDDMVSLYCSFSG